MGGAVVACAGMGVGCSLADKRAVGWGRCRVGLTDWSEYLGWCQNGNGSTRDPLELGRAQTLESMLQRAMRASNLERTAWQAVRREGCD
jgi:hypothetical protein